MRKVVTREKEWARRGELDSIDFLVYDSIAFVCLFVVELLVYDSIVFCFVCLYVCCRVTGI